MSEKCQCRRNADVREMLMSDVSKGSKEIFMKAFVKEPKRPSSSIQGLDQGAKKIFTKGSVALAKKTFAKVSKTLDNKPRRPLSMDPRLLSRSQEDLHQGSKALAKEPRRISPRVPRSQEDFLQGFQGAKKTFTVRLG